MAFDGNDEYINAVLRGDFNGVGVQQEEEPQLGVKKKDTGIIEEIGRGLSHGAQVTLPKMIGESLQFAGAEDAGKEIVQNAEVRETEGNRESDYGASRSQWNPRSGVYEAADNSVGSLAPGAAGAAIGAGIGSVLPGVGTAAGALVGYGLGSLAALPMFYGSQAQNSYEKIKKAKLDAGATPEVAEREARIGGHEAGTIEAGGEAVADFIPFAKIFKPLMKPAAKAAGTTIKSMLTPTLKGAAKTLGAVEAGEVGTEMAQQAGESAVEGAHGAGEGATLEDTASVIYPTALMSLIPGAAGGVSHAVKLNAMRKALEDEKADQETRTKLAMGIVKSMEDENPELARGFALYAGHQIESNSPIELHDDQFYTSYKKEAAQAEPVPSLPNRPYDTMYAFSDGSTGTQSQIDAYLNGLPEDKRAHALAVMMYGAHAVEETPTEQNQPKALPSYPHNTMYAFSDGSVGTQKQIDEHLNSLPKEQRVSALANLMYGAKVVTPDEQVPHPDAPPTSLSAAVNAGVKSGAIMPETSLAAALIPVSQRKEQVNGHQATQAVAPEAQRQETSAAVSAAVTSQGVDNANINAAKKESKQASEVQPPSSVHAEQAVAAPTFAASPDGRLRVTGFTKEQISAARDQLKLKQVVIGNNGSAIFPKGTDAKELKAALGVAEEKAGPKAKKARQASTDLRGRIIQLGGINSKYASDVTGEQKPKGAWKFAFGKNGLGLDDLATQLAAEGFNIDLADHTDNGGVNQLAEMIRRHIGGERAFKATTQEAQAEAMAKDQARQDDERRAQELGIKDAHKLDDGDLRDAIYAAEDAIIVQQRLENEAEAEAIAAFSDAAMNEEDIEFVPSTPDALAEWMGVEHEQGKTETGVQQAVAEGAESGAGTDRGTTRQEEGAGQDLLQSYTNAEVLAREAAKAKAEEGASKEPPAKNVTADQTDLFNTQDSLFNSNREQPAAESKPTILDSDMPLFHGTRAGNKFSAFDVSGTKNKGVGSNVFNQGHYAYLTQSREAAQWFADKASENAALRNGETPSGQAGDVLEFTLKKGAKVLRIENMPQMGKADALIDRAKADGVDAIIFRDPAFDAVEGSKRVADMLNSGEPMDTVLVLNHDMLVELSSAQAGNVKRPPKFKVAMRLPTGEIVTATGGETIHAQIFNRLTETRREMADDSFAEKVDFGFVDENGKYYTRDEATSTLGRNAEGETLGENSIRSDGANPENKTQKAKSKKLEVLKAQAQGKITGDQGAALKELADAGEHAAVDEVLKPAHQEYKTGEPVSLSVYHGSNHGGVSRQPSGLAFFTDDKKAARSYGKKVVQVKIELKNPKVIDYEGADDSNLIGFDIQDAEEAGYDGIIALNTDDGKQVINQFVVFKYSDSIDTSAKPAKETQENRQIGDFGEKLEGAKKDLWQTYRKAMSDELPADLKEITLSKHFPDPDYEGLIAAGTDIRAIAAIKAMRDEIPAKPHKTYKLQRWGEQLKTLRAFSNDILNGSITVDRVMSEMRKVHALQGIAERIDLYSELGYPALKSAKGYEVSGGWTKYNNESYKAEPGIQWAIKNPQNGLAFFTTRQEAVDALRAKLATEPEKEGGRSTRLDIYRVTATGDIVIGKKLASNKYIDLKAGFESARDARDYLAQHEKELLDLLEKKKETPPERRSTNNPRIGKDHRLGEDVTPEKFAAEFGFRGVQFGNYVEQSRRSKDLNNAYDALLDMASTIGIPPRAISLNGTLGLAFGARGSGKAAAHYEPGKVVINLTKTNGQGSLGHEWFHSLDNYFSRMRGENDKFVTNRPSQKMVRGTGAALVADESVRPEVLQAFERVMKAIKSAEFYRSSQRLDGRRTKDYWSTDEELAARAFEAYLIAKAQERGEANDYLANVVDEDVWKAAEGLGFEDENTYPYPTHADQEKLNPLFDALFQTLQTKETDKGVALFSRSTPQTKLYSQLARQIESAPDRVFSTGKQTALWLQSNTAKLGIKKDELYWTGITDWLQTQGKVTKADVLAYLDGNGVQIKEVMLGAKPEVIEQDGKFVVRKTDGTLLSSEFGVSTFAKRVFAEQAAQQEQQHDTKYEKYQLPGGENYHELLLALPDRAITEWDALRDEMQEKYGPAGAESDAASKEDKAKWRNAVERGSKTLGKEFRSGHYEQPNILAHIRFNESTDATGAKTLFIEEIQSDWGQKGKKEGFGKKELLPAEAEELRTLNAKTWQNGYELTPEERARLNELNDKFGERLRNESKPAVPSAPFVTDTKSWTALALKRMIAYAIDNGFSRVAWTTGEQQAARYDLSKQVDSLLYKKNADGSYRVSAITGSRGNMLGESIAENNLEDYVGKDVAKKMITGEGKRTEVQGKYDPVAMVSSRDYMHELSGVDLKVGGEGMKGYYDQIVPQVASDIIKKFGGKVEQVDIAKGGREGRAARAEDVARMKREGSITTQPGFTITPEMRSKVQAEGLPMFSASSSGRGLSVSAVESIANPIAEKLKNIRTVKVVARQTEIPGLKEQIDAAYSRFQQDRTPENLDKYLAVAKDDIEGAYVNGELYLVASNLGSVGRVNEVLRHEVAHLSVEQMLEEVKPGLYDSLLKNVRLLDKGGNKYIRELAAAVDRTQPGLDERTRSAEIIAQIAERGDHEGMPNTVRSLYQRLMDGIKAFYKLVFGDTLNDQDVRDIVAQSFRWARGEQDIARVIGGEVRQLSRGDLDFTKPQAQDNRHGDQYDFATTQTQATAHRFTTVAGLPAKPDFAENTWVRETVPGQSGKERPIVVYRGEGRRLTPDDFTKEALGYASGHAPSGRGVHFTTRKSLADKHGVEAGGQTSRYMLDIRKPREIHHSEIDKEFAGLETKGDYYAYRESLRQQGYDGIIVDQSDIGGGYDIIAFDPHQVIQAPSSPMFSRAGETIIGDTGRERTQAQLNAFRNLGRAVTQPTLEERIKGLWKDAGKKLAQGIADQFRPIRDLDSNAYTLMRLSKGASGAFEVLLNGGQLKLKDGVYDFDTTKKGGVVERLLQPLQGEADDFLWWVAANRAEQLSKQDREHLFTPEDIAAMKTLADGQTKYTYTLQHGPNKGKTATSRAEVYADSLKTFNEFHKNTLDMAEQSGLIDGESRKLWESEFYVPFYRVEEDESGVRGMNIKSGVVRQQAFKQLKGGTGKLNSDLLDNALMNWAHLLDASAKNRAAKATLEAADKMGVAGPVPEGTKKAVWYMDKGQKRHYLVEDPHVLDAITSLEYAGMRNPLMNAMGTLKHALTIGVTASPFFKVRNLIRDSVQSIAVSGLDYNAAANVKKGWELTKPKSDAYFRLLAGGGTIHFGTMMEGSESRRVRSLVDAGVDESTILDSEAKYKAFYRRVIEPSITAYNELGNRGEAVNRASLYDQLIQQGKSHAEASLLARDLMDFSMQGSWTSVRFLTQTVPFLNARLQGLYKLGRAAGDDPRKMGVVLGACAVASIALMLAYSDDDDWKKREDWDRDNYWWFKIGGEAFRIPKPFEIGAIASVAERGVELFSSDEMTGERFRGRMLQLLSDNLAMNPMPQLVKPILDVYANKDSFTGRPIETMGMERLDPEYRFTQKTSMAARGLSTATMGAASPVQIDHLIRGYFGWLGTFIVGSADVIAKPATGQASGASIDYMKVATGGMIAGTEDAQSRYVSQMYKQAKEIEQAHGTWRYLQKSDPEAAREYLAEHRDDLIKYPRVEAIKRLETSLNLRIRLIERSDKSPEEKRNLIRQINESKDRIARRVANGLPQ